MNPVRVSTSKSCAARVVVSTTPAGGPTRTSGRGSARKWLGGRKAIQATVEMRRPSKIRYYIGSKDPIFGESICMERGGRYQRGNSDGDEESMSESSELAWPGSTEDSRSVVNLSS